MADFCRKCTEELFGKEFADKISMSIKDDEFLVLLCEGCGRNVRVDNKGNILECNTCANAHEGTCNDCEGENFGHTTEISGDYICCNYRGNYPLDGNYN